MAVNEAKARQKAGLESAPDDEHDDVVAGFKKGVSANHIECKG